MKNIQYLLAKRVIGTPPADAWTRHEADVPEPGDGQLLVRIQYISLDPAMRGWMDNRRSYIAPVEIGAVMRAGTVGEVVASNNDQFPVGTHVVGTLGVQQYALSDGSDVHPIDATLAPLPRYLGTLGMTGWTAYFGLLRVGEPKAGDTVLVSGAAGAVGSVVGQIAKLKGCRVVGIAGGAEKCRYLTEVLGFDAAVDYKTGKLVRSIREHCPHGVDVYFDNVGGEVLDAALINLSRGARVVICGAISQYNTTEGVRGPANYLSLLVNRARMQGMVVFDYAKDYGKASREMAGWMMEGKLRAEEDVYEGIDNFHETFLRLFNGDKRGKLVLKI